MSEYLELQNVVRNGSVITDVKFDKNRIYFRVDGHLFSTFSNYAHHEDNPLFDHPVLDYQARSHNTAEGIAADEKRSEEIDKELELFHKHQASLYKLIMLRGLEIMIEQGEDEGVKYINYHFDIMENGNHCKKLLKQLEDASSD